VPHSKTPLSNTSIDKSEFVKLMPSMSEEDIDALFSLYDINHDGSIKWKEYICIITLIMHGSMRDKIRLIFNCFDADGNGILSKEEFLSAAEKFSSAANSKQIAEQYYKECDRNGDGKVSFSEFCDWVHANQDKYETLVGVLTVINLNDE